MTSDQPSRISRDSHGERTRYEDIDVGSDLGELRWTVTPDMVAKQCAIDGDYDPIYELTDNDPQFAPPQILYRPPRWLLSRQFNIRGVLVKWSFEVFAPIEVNRPMTLRGRISDKWIKSDREYVSYDVTASYDDTTVFRTSRVHLMDIIERNRPRQGEGVDSGKKDEKI